MHLKSGDLAGNDYTSIAFDINSLWYELLNAQEFCSVEKRYHMDNRTQPKASIHLQESQCILLRLFWSCRKPSGAPAYQYISTHTINPPLPLTLLLNTS